MLIYLVRNTFRDYMMALHFEGVNLKSDVIGHLINYSVFHPAVREFNTYKILNTTKVQ